jgi:hypothetical protein
MPQSVPPGFSPAPARFWLEAAAAAACLALALLTLVSREWIELLFRVDPDGGSGALEWGVVAAAGALSVLFGALARRDLRRPAPAFEGGR